VPFPRSAAQSVGFENQADCVSGAWARYADQQGWLELPDDLGDIESLLRAIGTREGPGRDHGTAAERARAFDQGFRTGLKACNSFSPSAPISPD
jgi:predicted metalloprotease